MGTYFWAFRDRINLPVGILGERELEINVGKSHETKDEKIMYLYKFNKSGLNLTSFGI